MYNRANMKELFEAEVWLRQMARLRNFVRKNSPRVLELCCFEWFQNPFFCPSTPVFGFRAVLFRMVPKHKLGQVELLESFRAVLFRMVPKHTNIKSYITNCFRAVLFRMVPKLQWLFLFPARRFRAVLFRMVPKHPMVEEINSYCFRAVLFRMVPKLSS